MQTQIYSIGHSSLAIEPFIQILKHYQIEAIADVRRFPTSRKYPHFERSHLAEKLYQTNITYYWLGEKLGGFRKEGYQSYIKSESFLSGLQELMQIASKQVTAILCAEKLVINCHRRYIADHLTHQKWTVIHIVAENLSYPHFPTASLHLDFSN